MLLPRPSGSSLLKILRHEHLLYHLVLVLVISLLHDINDVIGGIFDLCQSRGRFLRFLNLGGTCPGTISQNMPRAIVA